MDSTSFEPEIDPAEYGQHGIDKDVRARLFAEVFAEMKPRIKIDQDRRHLLIQWCPDSWLHQPSIMK